MLSKSLLLWTLVLVSILTTSSSVFAQTATPIPTATATPTPTPSAVLCTTRPQSCTQDCNGPVCGDNYRSYCNFCLACQDPNVTSYTVGACTITATPTPSPTPTPIPTPIPGDIDHNGRVDIYDYNTLVGDFGQPNSPADLNGNGTVDIYDYNIIVANFGRTI